MKTKAFVMLLLGVLLLGGSLGGSFAAGMALGKSKGEAAAKDSQTAQSTQSGQTVRQQLQEQFQQGQLTPEQLQRLQQFQQQSGGTPGPGQRFFSGTPVPGGGGMGFAGMGGLTGTIESMKGNQITINAAQGTLQVNLAADATIQKFSTGTPADLKVGTRVSITGQRGTDGVVQAGAVTIIPEGMQGLPGTGGRMFQGRGALTPTPQAGR